MKSLREVYDDVETGGVFELSVASYRWIAFVGATLVVVF